MAQDQYDPTYGVEDPATIAEGEQQQWNKLVAAQPGQAAQLRMQNRQLLSGPSPGIQAAQQQSQALKDILQQSNANAPDNEDPLDAQLRQANAVARGMVGVSPQAATQAAQLATRLQEAKNQQALLSQQTAAEGELYKQRAAANAAQRYVLVKQGDPDKFGIRGLEAITTLDPNAPDFAQQMTAAQAAAAKNGDTVVPLTGDQFLNGRTAVAQMRGQYALQAAQVRAQEAWQAAMLKSQTTGGMTGREAQMTMRILSSAELGSQALQNIMELPLGSSSGWFGTQYGAASGSTLTTLTGGNLRNAVSSQDTQSYSVQAAGLERNLAMLEMQGGLQGGQHFSEQMSNALRLRPGDTYATMMTKLAEAKQIITTATRVYMANPKLTDQVRESVRDSLDRLNAAIPFTVHDVNSFLKEQQKNPRMTLGDYAQAKGLGVVEVKTDADYNNLSSGTRFVGPDGKQRVKP